MKKTAISFLIMVIVISIINIPLSAQASFLNIETKSKNIYMVNTDTDTVVYEKDAHEKLYPASTTKMMTALLFAEKCDDLENTVYTIPTEVMQMLQGTDSSMAGFLEGEEVPAIDVLYGLLLPSGNECALTIAYYLGDEDISAFVGMMNDKAQELGMEDTHFVNPNGLHDDDHYTTAYDMALLAREVMKNDKLMEVCSTRRYVIEATNKQTRRAILTTNYLIDNNSTYYTNYVRGIKTGRTSQAGNCLVSTATKNGYTYICVTMGADAYDTEGKRIKENYAFQDTKELYKLAFDSLQIKEIVSDTQIIAEIPVEFVWNKDYIALVPEQDYRTLVPSSVNSETIIIETKLQENVQAPVQKGDILGQATLKYGKDEIGTVNLVAAESVERNFFLYASSAVLGAVKSKTFIIIVSAIAALIILYIILVLKVNSKGGNKKRKKKSRYI